MNKIEVCQKIVSIPRNLFSILSKMDNLLLFCSAEEGLKIHSSELHEDIPSRKRYYTALKQLKAAGLIEKSSKERGVYHHTTFGSLVFQRHIIGMAELTGKMQKMEMIDTARQTNRYPEVDTKEIVGDVILMDTQKDSNSLNLLQSIIPETIWTYDELISSLTRRIRNSKKEILIAARLSSETLINEIIHKSKTGIEVKILADTKLVQGYFKSQTQIQIPDDNGDNFPDKSKEKERLKVIGNPWYPNDEGINRRVFDIPFGMIIIDGKEVGIELVNHNNTQSFFAGILITDNTVATRMKDLFHKMWDSSKDV
ncbi:MAG: hypothetical protein M3162_00300 [Thermoproteota archaeon]|nr:hypothetical protein [Thermoproteota archaeon]